ncbi:MAG TPA: DUF1295 domain-containing protein, partial [Prolixibacteraceae bacterium]|nr:DUF1295 domain-containing protein [Prolixibacteraceae bacterium]
MESLNLSLAVLAGLIIVCFVAGLLTRNHSHVDRLWSLLPPILVIIWFPEDPEKQKAFLIPALLVLAWGIRLTWNFGRKGGYTFVRGKGFTGEDYRWPILRRKIGNRFFFELFHFFFICVFQLSLIFAFTLPLYYLGQTGYLPGKTDYALYLLHALLLLYETLADNQQYSFHSRKNRLPYRHDPRYRLGFNTLGLWRHSRHPNYMAELGQWIVVWLYLVSATGTLHISGSGALVLILLFLGSTY